MAGIAKIDLAEPGEGLAVAAVAGRHDAVEHVDAAGDRREQVVGRADAHEVMRLVVGQVRHDLLDHGQHHRLRLADGEAADGIAGKSMAARALALATRRSGWSPPWTMPNSARPRAALRRAARALRPAQRQLHRLVDGGALVGQRHAFVELHLDVGAEEALDLHRALGVSSKREPSTWLAKVTPCSVSLRSLASDMTWKPPESVRMGRTSHRSDAGRRARRCAPRRGAA